MRLAVTTSRALATGLFVFAPLLGAAKAGTAHEDGAPTAHEALYDLHSFGAEPVEMWSSSLTGPKIVPVTEAAQPKLVREPTLVRRERGVAVASLGPQRSRPVTDAAARARPEAAPFAFAPTPPVPPLLTKAAERSGRPEMRLPVLEDRRAVALEEALVALAANPPVHTHLIERKAAQTERGRPPMSRLVLQHMTTRWSDPLSTLPPEEAEGAGWPEFIMPFAGGRVTSLFNQGRRHPAIDLAGALGSPVLATTSGQKVVFAGWRGGYGNAVITQDGYGWTHLYGHLKSITSRVGQMLSQGERLGHLGSTGHSTGPHVHYEVRNAKGQHINPVTLLFPGRSVSKGLAWSDVGQFGTVGTAAQVAGRSVAVDRVAMASQVEAEPPRPRAKRRIRSAENSYRTRGYRTAGYSHRARRAWSDDGE